MMTTMRCLCAGLVLLIPITTAFSSATSRTLTSASRSSTCLAALGINKKKSNTKQSTLPTFNTETQRWEASPLDTDPGYGPFGTFLRQGPPPALVRLVNADLYEQAVLKYMAREQCSRAEAQGNMDAYFNNAADWAFQKQAQARGAPKVDYSQLKMKQAVLTLTWAVFITSFLGRIYYLAVVTGIGWGVHLDDIFGF